MPEKNLEIYLNFSCNQKCLHCFNTDSLRRKNKNLTFNQVARTIFKMKKLGYKNLFLLGGEPTVHPDLMKIIFLAKKLGFKEITLFTNGQKFSSWEFAEKAKKAGLTNCYISMHGHKKNYTTLLPE